MNDNKYSVENEEPLMTINKIYKTVVLKNEDAAIMKILRLILLEPGTIQTHPDCGVGIVSRFRYSTDIDIGDLSSRISSQINTYLPQYTNVKVACELDNNSKSIRIFITSDQLNAVIPINIETGKVLEDMKN